jgi:uncharacterized delta-60 repeat protein
LKLRASVGLILAVGLAVIAPLDPATAVSRQPSATTLNSFPYVAESALPLSGSRILVTYYGNGPEWASGVAALEPDGSLDPSFGAAGLFSWPVGTVRTEGEFPDPVALDGSGRILIVSAANGQAAVTRLLPDGNPDQNFGDGGTATIALGAGASAGTSIAVAPGGHILVGGYFNSTCPGDDPRARCPSYPALAKLNSDGTPDTGFGHHGLVTVHPLGQEEEARVHDMAVAPGGKILVATDDVGGIAIHRLRHDGTIDQSFGRLGQILIAEQRRGQFRYAGIHAVPKVAVTRAGKIVVAGEHLIRKPGHLVRYATAAMRFDADGRVDRAFGANGRVVFHLGRDSFTSSFVLRPNGSMVLAGHAFRGGRSFLTFASLRSDGTLNSRFGHRGLARIGFNSGSTVVGTGLALQDGLAVAVGNLLMDTGRLTLLARVPLRN